MFSLVDHNENPELESLGQVIQIVDHHKRSKDLQQKSLSDYVSGVPKDVEVDETVGSCCTLVAKRYLFSPHDSS